MLPEGISQGTLDSNQPYIIVFSDNIPGLARLVSDMYDHGYRPYEGPFSFLTPGGKTVVCQAMELTQLSIPFTSYAQETISISSNGGKGR